MNTIKTTNQFVTVPTVLGEVDLSEINYRQGGPSRAQQCRNMLEILKPQKATIFEMRDKKEAEDYRSMLYTMAILKFSESGRIATRIVDNLLYVWLT
ncbi:MAG: hypothetical protein GYA48_15340 [Chloroflexi bacterium]|nr:hypothetical protein [Chloroflexota bacterium]